MAEAAFFSYCREDSDFALRLAEDLKAAGANVWMDQLDIEPGMRWDRAVEAALNNCPRTLVILSPAAVDSDNVLDEVSRALRKQKTVIPVLYLDCDIPLRLERHQQVDFRTDYDRGLKLLLKTLGVEQPPQPIFPTLPEAKKEGQPPVSDVVELAPTAEQTRLEQDRRLAEEQARLDEECRLTALAQAERERRALEGARLERMQAAERALEEERRKAEEQERLEQQRKQEAEQAWLDEQRKAAAEKARLEKEERERQAAAEKARLEQQECERPAAEEARLNQQKHQASPAGPGGTGPTTEPTLVSPTFKKIAAVVVGIVLLSILVYWAVRPKIENGDAQKTVSKAEVSSSVSEGPLSQAVWVGFNNDDWVDRTTLDRKSPDREPELRRLCGDFERIYVPVYAGDTFTDLCRFNGGMSCERVCDWKGNSLPCSTGGIRDGESVALCSR